MLRKLWAVLVFALYLAAIAWLICSKIIEKLAKKQYSFVIDMAIFVCLFITAAIVIAILLY